MKKLLLIFSTLYLFCSNAYSADKPEYDAVYVYQVLSNNNYSVIIAKVEGNKIKLFVCIPSNLEHNDNELPPLTPFPYLENKIGSQIKGEEKCHRYNNTLKNNIMIYNAITDKIREINFEIPAEFNNKKLPENMRNKLIPIKNNELEALDIISNSKISPDGYEFIENEYHNLNLLERFFSNPPYDYITTVLSKQGHKIYITEKEKRQYVQNPYGNIYVKFIGWSKRK